jgi:hypothetical protein
LSPADPRTRPFNPLTAGRRVMLNVAAAATLCSALTIGAALAADSPYHLHCDAATDIGGYYIGEMASLQRYTGDDAAKIIEGLVASGYYSATDEATGATTIWIGIDETDSSSTIFFYGDNGCAFGYDDTWDRDSIDRLLDQIGLALPTSAGPTF